jgi:hypothetical protein
VVGQKKGLEELESLITQARTGKLTENKKAVYRSRNSIVANDSTGE